MDSCTKSGSWSISFSSCARDMSISGWGNIVCGSLFISISASVDLFGLLDSAEQLTVNNIVIITKRNSMRIGYFMCIIVNKLPLICNCAATVYNRTVILGGI